MFPLGDAPIKRIGYIFDFQHRYIPELFPSRIRRNRDRMFSAIARDSDGIVVNAKAVAHDVMHFLGVPKDSILTMPFAPYALPWWFDTCPTSARTRYGVRKPYLLICNHFWKHKDHATALRAFALLREQQPNLDVELVMTGDPVDHRDPRHYSGLLRLAEKLGISSNTHFLGLIPKRHQLALMRECLGLVQPTRFEGGPGGGSVYEAIGLGVPVIVSDIPVNLEIDQGDVFFFRTGDASELAKQMTNVLNSSSLRPTQETLLAAGNSNLARMGNAICDYLAEISAK